MDTNEIHETISSIDKNKKHSKTYYCWIKRQTKKVKTQVSVLESGQKTSEDTCDNFIRL